MRAGDLPGCGFAQLLFDPGANFDFKNVFDKESACGIGHAQAGQLSAGVIEPHHTAGGIEHGNQGGD